MSKHYLIFERGAHSVVYFAHGDTATDAIRRYIVAQNVRVAFQDDGTLVEDDVRYEHPLAYVEASYKVHGEWQIRELPEWAWRDAFSEVFCGESEDGPTRDADKCREWFAREHPGVRAKSFVWYLTEGHLISFYRRRGQQVTILARYLLRFGRGGMFGESHPAQVEVWTGGYEQIAEGLDLVPPQWLRPFKP